MNNKKDIIAVYPGTFDPITLGHEDIIKNSCKIFNKVIIAIAVGHHKKTLFNLEERVLMIKKSLIDSYELNNLEIQSFEGLLKDFILRNKAQVIIRGIRSVLDFDYEIQMLGMNNYLMPEVQTVFMIPKPNFQCISSTLVKEIANLGGDLSSFVSQSVKETLINKIKY